jgi:FtsH-binding integral membrane protein
MKSRITEIKWGVIFTIFMLLWMIMEKVLGFHGERIEQHMIITNFVAIPAIVIYVLALLDKRKRDLNGKMTYVQGLISGIIISIVVAVFTPLTQYIINTVISPDYFSNMIAYTVENDIMTEQAAKDYFNLESYIIQSTIGAPIMGILTTAIVALFVRKK